MGSQETQTRPKNWPTGWTFWANRYFEIVFLKFPGWTPLKTLNFLILKVNIKTLNLLTFEEAFNWTVGQLTAISRLIHMAKAQRIQFIEEYIKTHCSRTFEMSNKFSTIGQVYQLTTGRQPVFLVPPVWRRRPVSNNNASGCG